MSARKGGGLETKATMTYPTRNHEKQANALEQAQGKYFHNINENSNLLKQANSSESR